MLITKRTRTAADGEKHDATLAMDLDGTRHPLKEQLPVNTGVKCYQSMCIDVVIGIVIGKTTAYCRLQRTKEYTKANYSLRAKSQTSSPPRREDSDSLVSTITQAGCENNTVMEVKSMKSQKAGVIGRITCTVLMLITKRTETAAGSTMNPSQRTRTEMGTDMYQVENYVRTTPGINALRVCVQMPS